VENWVRTGVLVPDVKGEEGTGHNRRFTFRMVVLAAIAVELSKLRMPVPMIKNITQGLMVWESPTLPFENPRVKPPTAAEHATWEMFKNPATRGDISAVIYFIPGGYAPLLAVQPTRSVLFPPSRAALMVNVLQILQELEKATGDRWMPAKVPPSALRKEHKKKAERRP
jgi:hypothetical protein